MAISVSLVRLLAGRVCVFRCASVQATHRLKSQETVWEVFYLPLRELRPLCRKKMAFWSAGPKSFRFSRKETFVSGRKTGALSVRPSRPRWRSQQVWWRRETIHSASALQAGGVKRLSPPAFISAARTAPPPVRANEAPKQTPKEGSPRRHDAFRRRAPPQRRGPPAWCARPPPPISRLAHSTAPLLVIENPAAGGDGAIRRAPRLIWVR